MEYMPKTRPSLHWRSHWGVRGRVGLPLDSENSVAKNREKEGENQHKEGENQEKEGKREKKIGKRGKIGKILSLCPSWMTMLIGLATLLAIMRIWQILASVLHIGGRGALVSKVGYHPRKKIHVIRVVFQDQAMYARTSFTGAKMCKIGKKGVFFVILTKFGKDMMDKLRKNACKTRI